MNRFYKDVATGPAIGGGFVIQLDGRPIRTPAKSLMLSPTQELAMAIAKEWEDQGEMVLPATMPLTQLLTTDIDRRDQRAEITTEILKYLNGDLLCYRASEPEGLTAEQEKLWHPWLKWFDATYGVPLETTFALSRLDQPQAAHDVVAREVTALDDHAFTVLQMVVGLSGSMVLALATVRGAITPEDSVQAALCEELYYERTHDLTRHGLDPIEEKRRAALERDFKAARDYLKSTRS